MPDRYAVIWTRGPHGPMKMGQLVATGEQTRFSYTESFLAQTQIAGFSLLASPQLYGTQPIIHKATEILPLHPRLLALLPARAHNNIQRRVYAEVLAKRAQPPNPGFDTEWELLLLAGHNGIGHLDVFGSDLDAEQYYQRSFTSFGALGKRSNFWQFLRNDFQTTVADHDIDMVALIGPTPSVGGMIPKVLVAIPDQAHWDGSIAPPGVQRVADEAYVDVVLKIEYPEYAGLSELEALCLETYSQLGFNVPRYWRLQVDGMNLLAIERFDRDEHGLPIPVESFFSVMASGATDVMSTTGTDMERVARMLAALPRVAEFDAQTAQIEVYRRFCVAVLTGNGDMHLENLSFLGGNQSVCVSPVYDPAPMRAWPRHNLLSAIPFAMETSLRASIITLGTAFGLSKAHAQQTLDALYDATADYPQQIADGSMVPAATRDRLIQIVLQVRKKLANSA